METSEGFSSPQDREERPPTAISKTRQDEEIGNRSTEDEKEKSKRDDAEFFLRLVGWVRTHQKTIVSTVVSTVAAIVAFFLGVAWQHIANVGVEAAKAEWDSKMAAFKSEKELAINTLQAEWKLKFENLFATQQQQSRTVQETEKSKFDLLRDQVQQSGSRIEREEASRFQNLLSGMTTRFEELFSSTQRNSETIRQLAFTMQSEATSASIRADSLRESEQLIRDLQPVINAFKSSVNELGVKLTSDSKFMDRLAAEAGLSSLPPGTIVAWPGSVPGDAWHICNGEVVDDVSGKLRPILEQASISQPKDRGKVCLPDYQGYFLRGFDPEAKIDTEPRSLGDRQSDAFASHSHHVKLGGGAHKHTGSIVAALSGGGGDNDADPNGAQNKSISFEVSGGEHEHEGDSAKSGGVETRPKNVSVNWIIKIR